MAEFSREELLQALIGFSLQVRVSDHPAPYLVVNGAVAEPETVADVLLATLNANRARWQGWTPAQTLRNAAGWMRFDGQDWAAEVARWLDIQAAALDQHLPEDSGTAEVALRIARAYLHGFHDKVRAAVTDARLPMTEEAPPCGS